MQKTSYIGSKMVRDADEFMWAIRDKVDCDVLGDVDDALHTVVDNVKNVYEVNYANYNIIKDENEMLESQCDGYYNALMTINNMLEEIIDKDYRTKQSIKDAVKEIIVEVGNYV